LAWIIPSEAFVNYELMLEFIILTH